MKKKFLYVIALAALMSCSSDEFVGDSGSAGSVNVGGGEKAIQFTSNTPQVTRSEGAVAAEELGYSFNVYATKTTEGETNSDDDDVISNVFALNPYHATSNTPYKVWYTQNTANTTTSNTYGWEYVGVHTDPATNYGTDGYTVTLDQDQTIKYWDYSAKNYVFTAFKANKPDNEENAGAVTNVTTSGFTFTGTPAQFASLYVADKVTITEKSNPAAHTTADNKIGDVVQFTFRSAAAKVRLGIYETIPGYVVKNLSFRPNGDITGFTTPTSDATLSGKFMGNSTISSLSGGSKTFTITYNPLNVAISDLEPSPYFNFGTFASSADAGIGITSTAPTWAGGSSYASANYYQIALPNINPSNVDNMVLYVNYDLYNSVSGETINVTGAKAVVPAMYMTWKANYAYTYLFKISDNTSGTTGTEGASPAGLFPITFDAVTVATTEGQDVGIISTVSVPTVTTYQTNSVVDIETTEPAVVSKHGITYANANGPIYITVNTNGTLADLSAGVAKLYTVDEGTTEADLLLNVAPSSINKVEVSEGVLIIPSSGDDETIQGITFTIGKYAKFTPAANTTYAFEYNKAAVGNPCEGATGTYVEGTKYYTDNTGATEVNTTGFEAGVTDVSSYFVANPSYEPAEKAYKVIQVAAGS